MARSPHYVEPRRESYSRLTHQPMNGIIFVVPLLVLFHVGSAFSHTALFASRDLARILSVFGATAWYIPPLLVVSVLLLQHLAQRRRWRFEPRVLAGMLAESLLWTLPLFAINYLCSRLLDAGGMLAAHSGAFHGVLLAAGAGVYEEFIFRLVLIGLLVWALGSILGAKRKDLSVLVALIISALAFSLYHFSWGSDGSAASFDWGLFVFRTAAGICLGIVYAFRGLGIAVGAHTVWNLYAVFVNG